MGYEWLIMLPGAVGVGAIAFCKLLDVGYDLYNGDGGHQRRFEQFTMDARRRGLSPRETFDELDVREHFAMLRRVASDRLAGANAADWHDVLEAAKKETVEAMAQAKPHLVPDLARMMESVGFDDVFYPDQAARIDAYFAAELREKTRPTQDQYAALRIV